MATQPLAHVGVMLQSLFHCSGPTQAYFTNHVALSPDFCLDDLNKWWGSEEGLRSTAPPVNMATVDTDTAKLA